MKKLVLLLTLFVAVAITGCKKDDDQPQTLEQKYPEWKKLTWISTTVSPEFSFYKLDVSIDGDVITTTFTDVNNTKTVDRYRDMHIDWDIIEQTNTGFIYSTTSGAVLFSWGISPADRATWSFEINRTEKTITVFANPNTYKLKIN